MPLEKVVSGGTAGVELAALRAACALGLATGGVHLPGCAPDAIKAYGLRGYCFADALSRLLLNVDDGQGTLVLAEDLASDGVAFVRERCGLSYREFLALPLDDLRDADRAWEGAARRAVDFVRGLDQGMLGYGVTLHVTGAREKDGPGVQALAEQFLREVFDRLDP